MKKSPWLADAKSGATGVTYEVRTIADFLKVPEDRRRVCLREFDAWLSMQVTLPDLIHAVARSLGTPLPAEAITVRDPDVFRWVDDGKATISVELYDKEQPLAVGAATDLSDVAPPESSHD